MKEYKENEVRKDMFYEEQKREQQQDAVKKRLEHEAAQKAELEKTKNSLEDVDPWLQSKFNAEENKEETNQETNKETNEETNEETKEETKE